MSFRDWRPAIAVGLILFWVAPALSQQSKQPALKSEPIPNTGQQKGAQDGQQAPATKEQGGSDLLPAIKGIEAAIREHIAKEDKRESERKEQREVDDLKAQQDMALWAERMFWATFAGLFLTFGGLVLIGFTLRYTRHAAIAAKEAVEEARKATSAAEATNAIVAHTARVELRAYLSVIPGGINELIGVQEAMGHVVVRNVGKLPARNVTLEVRMSVNDRGEDPLDPRLAEFPIKPDTKVTIDRAIQPSDEIRQGCNQDDVIAVMAFVRQPTRYAYVWGAVYYDDGYTRRFTNFRHRYAIVSHREDRWDLPAGNTRVIIAADKARHDPFGNNLN